MTPTIERKEKPLRGGGGSRRINVRFQGPSDRHSCVAIFSRICNSAAFVITASVGNMICVPVRDSGSAFFADFNNQCNHRGSMFSPLNVSFVSFFYHCFLFSIRPSALLYLIWLSIIIQIIIIKLLLLIIKFINYYYSLLNL